MADYLNVKINVNGKIQNVKMEKGVTISPSKDNVHYSFGQDNTLRSDDYSLYTKADMIKMTEGEFQLFKNIADNVKEGNGKDIILSVADIKKAQELYKQNKFTSDVSKGLTQKYNFDKSGQKLWDTSVYASAVEKTVPDDPVAVALHKSNPQKEGERISAFFGYGATHKNALAEKYFNASANGKVDIEQIGDNGGTVYTYKAKNGHEYSMHHSGYDGNGELLGVVEKYTTGDGKLVSVERDPKNKVTSISVNYTQNGKKISEHYDANGKLSWKDVEYKNTKGQQVDEYYNSDNVLSRRTYGNISASYENGKLVSVENSKDHSVNYYKDGKFYKRKVKRDEATYTYDANKKLISVYDRENATEFDVSSWANIERNEKAQEYYNEFKNMSSMDIAKKIHAQIYGPSRNQKTIDMLDGVPTERLIDVLKEYNNITNIIGDTQDSLTVALSDEWGMPVSAIQNVINRAYAAYLQVGHKFFSINENSDKLPKDEAIKYLNNIETKITRIEKYQQTEDGKQELKDYWYNFKKSIFGE